ncbi:hypothetical protein QJQ45_015597 [Haematococcus lacustris]|nr:hypothetical protein QJQ45_015597 [Haematococcus lacustris]
MLRQLENFCKFFANPNFLTVYDQLQRRLVRPGQRRHPMLMPVFEDPSNQALLQELGRERFVKLYAKAARARLNWSGEEAQLFIEMASTHVHQPHLKHLAAASSAGTSLVAKLKHITVTLATWDAVWEVYLDPKWARQRLRLYGAQDRALGQFLKKLQFEKDMAEVSMERHGRAKQQVVFFGAASIGTGGGWGADAVLQACCKVPPQAPCSQAATQPAAASEPGPSTPPPAKRSKRTKAEPAADPTQPTKGKGMGKSTATKPKPSPQPGRWLDIDCNAALNMQCIVESRWRPLELCYWPDQGALPAKGKEYPGLGYKRVRDKPPKAQQQHHQPAEAQ